MSKDKHKIKVVFRKFPEEDEGDIVALFPEEIYNEGLYGKSQIHSYQRVGQHSSASIELLTELEVASPSEYADLKVELESLGYNLKVSK